MYNLKQYSHCDRCDLFISKNPNHDRFCLSCGDNLVPATFYNTDRMMFRRHMYRQCSRCDSIYNMRNTKKCITCRPTSTRMERVKI